MPDPDPITIRDLYPDFRDAELEEAEANLRRYLTVLIRMAERLHAEGRSLSELAELTVLPERSNVQDERSNPSNH
jgi:hypothetical protein